MYKMHKETKLDLEAIRHKIVNKNIVKGTHVDEVTARKGRPSWELVKDHLEKPGTLYKAIKGRKNRVILVFRLSRKYDLRVVVRIKKKDLYVITFYFHIKRLKKWR